VRRALLPTALCLLLLGGCKEQPRYELVYPVQASKQQIHRLEGVRFVSTTDTPEISLIVLNNPVAPGSFVDIAFALTNTAQTPLTLSALPQARTGKGELKVLDRSAYAARTDAGERYVRPEGFEKLMPAMQKFGCAAQKSEDTLTPFGLSASQKQLWRHYRQYQQNTYGKSDDYFDGFTLDAGETKSAFVRVELPQTSHGGERETMLFTLCPEHYACKKMRLVIQPLENE